MEKVQETRSVVVSEEKMREIKKHLFAKYPYLHRKNTAYEVKMIVSYEITYSVNFDADITAIINE